jgi:Ala-tRNA(Pro) deacylase
MSIAPTLERYLQQQSLDYELVEHMPTKRSVATAEVSHVPPERIAKGILIESENRYLLVVIPASNRLELGSLHRRLGYQLGLATRPEVERVFGDCADGAVPVAGQAYGVRVLVDDALLRDGDVYFEAGDRTELVRMDCDSFRALMNGVAHGRFSVHAPRRGS